MTFASPADINDSEVVIQLLDPTQGSTVKTWKFHGKTTISIGRSEERDVEIVDSYVSREHALLQFHGGRWMVVSQGRNGVFVNNRRVEEHPITGDLTFRLGAAGPVLSFKTGIQRDENMATLCFESIPLPLLAVDESKLEIEVDAISTRDDFQRLQEQARALRRKKADS
jgi:pSer/pThr/pTyr-binding forkhead associated (FHA) protein